MRPGLAAVLLLLSFAATGCSALEETADTAGLPATTEARAPSGEPGRKRVPRHFKGAHAVRYERAYRVCEAFTVKELAREYGLGARPKRVARWHARLLYRPMYRRAAYAGCLDGLMGRAPGIG